MVLNSVETYRNLRLFFRCIEHFVAHPHANLSPIHTDFAWVFCVSSFLCGVVVMSQCNKSYKICRSFITFVVIEFGFAFERNENQSLYNISYTPIANNNKIFIQIRAHFYSAKSACIDLFQ